MIRDIHFHDCEAFQNLHMEIKVDDDLLGDMNLEKHKDLHRLANASESESSSTRLLSGHFLTLVITASLLLVRMRVYTNYSSHRQGCRSIIYVSGVGTMYAIVS